MSEQQRIMVDMTANLLHHGHIRLLKQAREYGRVIVGLTTDEQVLKHKGYRPELDFAAREEMLRAIEYVDDVVPTPWHITEEVLNNYNIDKLLHGADNFNSVSAERMIVLDRTHGVSSTDLRYRSLESIVSLKNQNKKILTPGPGSLIVDNLYGLAPAFGRGDNSYKEIEDNVLGLLKGMTQHDNICRLQASATGALEIAVRNFVFGKCLVIDSGYYSQRLAVFAEQAAKDGKIDQIDTIRPEEMDDVTGQYDWIIAVYTETAEAWKSDIDDLARLKDQCKAKLFLDSTGSIGIENHHDRADIIAYSSCKGLIGLTGASFIAFNDKPQVEEASFYLNIHTHLEQKTTGPYHTILSLFQGLNRYDEIRDAIHNSKKAFLSRFSDRLCIAPSHQPFLCTKIRGKLVSDSNDVIFYLPRTMEPGTSVACHIGEVHLDPEFAGSTYDILDIID